MIDFFLFSCVDCCDIIFGAAKCLVWRCDWQFPESGGFFSHFKQGLHSTGQLRTGLSVARENLRSIGYERKRWKDTERCTSTSHQVFEISIMEALIFIDLRMYPFHILEIY